MKPTEQDIQAELDRHGLGFELGNYRSDDGSFYLRHATCEYKIHAKLSERSFEIWTLDGMGLLREFDFDDVTSDRIVDVKPPTITVNASHWVSALALCRDLVRLITGEQVEQTLEEKVREIASKAKMDISYIHDDEVSLCNTVHQYWIKADRVTYNTPKGSHVDKTITGYYDDFGNYRHEFKAIAALLTEQPEQTLEEAVRGHLSGVNHESLKVSEDKVSFFERDELNNRTLYLITDGKICFEDGDWNELPPEKFLAEFGDEPNINLALLEIAALLSTRSTKPSYSDLEQRVEELGRELRDQREQYIQQGSVEGQKLEQAQNRITDLEAQLQDYISPADHEADMQEWREAFDELCRKHKEQSKKAKKYREWFHREYAKNAEASQ